MSNQTNQYPEMDQYLTMREHSENAILAYRMGDFYEFFFNDAEIVANALQMVLTTRGKHQGKPIPMTGLPVYSAERYLKTLMQQGHKVAIAEYIESESEFAYRKRKSSAPIARKRQIMRLLSPAATA